MKEHTFELGVTLKDIVTGVEGIATARVEYLTGCTQYGLTQQSEVGKETKTFYVDETRLEKVNDGVRKQVLDATATKPPGGSDADAPVANNDLR